jgi:hypothetical protein
MNYFKSVLTALLLTVSVVSAQPWESHTIDQWFKGLVAIGDTLKLGGPASIAASGGALDFNVGGNDPVMQLIGGTGVFSNKVHFNGVSGQRIQLTLNEGATNRYTIDYDGGGNLYSFKSDDIDGIGTNGDIYRVYDGTDDFIVPTGNVGIGTTAPAYELEIHTATPYIQFQTTSDNTAMGFKFRENGGSTLGEFHYDGTKFELDAVVSRDIYLSTSNGGLFIEGSNGNVGIGEISPDQLLEISGASGMGAHLNSAGHVNLELDAATSGYNSSLYFQENDANQFGIYYQGNANELVFYDYGVGAATMVMESGNVGIGTTTPAEQLEVKYNSAAIGHFGGIAIYEAGITQQTAGNEYGAGVDFYFDNAAGTDERLLSAAVRSRKTDNWSSVGATNKDANLEFYTLNQDAFGVKMVIEPDGNVGIGTTSPKENLHVSGSGDTRIALEATGAADAVIEIGHDVDAGVAWGLGMDDSNSDAFTIAYSASGNPSLTGDPLVTVATDGTVEIPDATIIVGGNGAIAAGAQVQAHGTGNTTVKIASWSSTFTDTPILKFEKSRSGTIGTSTATINDEKLGEIRFHGTDTGPSTSSISASILALQDGSAGTSNNAAEIAFKVSDGSAAATTRATLRSSGRFEFNKGTVFVQNTNDPVEVFFTPKIAGSGSADSVKVYRGSVTGVADDATVTIATGLDTSEIYRLEVDYLFNGAVTEGKHHDIAIAWSDPSTPYDEDIDMCSGGACEQAFWDLDGTRGSNGRYTIGMYLSGSDGVIEIENRRGGPADVMWKLVRGGG